MEVLQKLEDNIRERAKILNECHESEQLKQTIMAICSKDILYFFKYFVVTDRNASLIPERFGGVIPMMPFEFQEDFILDAWDAIQMGSRPVSERTEPTSIFSEKSRQMGFSWLFAGLQLYAFLFHNMKSTYISMKADEVDLKGDIKSHFEKIRFMIRGLPLWMLPEGLEKESGTEYNKSMAISRADSTGVIKGESANENAGRGGTVNFTIFDEMAFMANATAINKSVASTCPCRFFNSTPNGEGNEYYRMRELALDNKVRYHKCHRSENPYYTTEWYNWKVSDMTKEQIAQELEIDYNVAIKGRVYAGFTGNVDNVEYNPNKPLFIIIDNSHGGVDPNAIIVMQPNFDSNFWDIIDSIEINCDIPDIANFMAAAPKMALNDRELEFIERLKQYNWRNATYISDPYDTHSNIKNNHHPDGIVIYEEYTKVGIHLNTPDTRDNPKTTQIIKAKANLYRIRVNPRCSDFISAIQNAKYPEVKEGSVRTQPTNLPIHDWTSHYRTAFEYMVLYMLDNFVETQKMIGKEVKTTHEVRNPITGEIKIVYS